MKSAPGARPFRSTGSRIRQALRSADGRLFASRCGPIRNAGAGSIYVLDVTSGDGTDLSTLLEPGGEFREGGVLDWDPELRFLPDGDLRFRAKCGGACRARVHAWTPGAKVFRCIR